MHDMHHWIGRNAEDFYRALGKFVPHDHAEDCALGAVPACTCGLRDVQEALAILQQARFFEGITQAVTQRYRRVLLAISEAWQLPSEETRAPFLEKFFSSSQSGLWGKTPYTALAGDEETNQLIECIRVFKIDGWQND